MNTICFCETLVWVAEPLSMGLLLIKSTGVTPPSFTPSPFNLFMNIPVHEDRTTISFEAPTSEAGQYIILKAEMDLVVAFSACPQDILKINCGKPVDAHYEII
jgi:uncharacterized protein YcgI (DUF1989 family)